MCNNYIKCHFEGFMSAGKDSNLLKSENFHGPLFLIVNMLKTTHIKQRLFNVEMKRTFAFQ